jgi:hypothetical protein
MLAGVGFTMKCRACRPRPQTKAMRSTHLRRETVPTKRRRLKPRRIDLSAAAIRAWQEGDFHGLARALEIRPWQRHPWPLHLTALGIDPDNPPEALQLPWDASWERAAELQRALIAVAGRPPIVLK